MNSHSMLGSSFGVKSDSVLTVGCTPLTLLRENELLIDSLFLLLKVVARQVF